MDMFMYVCGWIDNQVDIKETIVFTHNDEQLTCMYENYFDLQAWESHDSSYEREILHFFFEN